MKALSLVTLTAFACAALSARIGFSPEPAPWRIEHFENVLGTSMEIKVAAASEVDANRAEASAMAEIARMNSILSGYDPSSEFSRWSATHGQAVPVSRELMEVLSLWDSWRVRSHGALSPAAEAVVRVWRKAEAERRLPAAGDLAAASTAAREPQWRLDADHRVAARIGDAPVKLNSFTKSFVVESAANAALRSPGVTGVVLNIGGDLVVRGAVSDSVNVADPFSDAENSDPIAVLVVKDRAVATSGNYRRGFDIGGRHHSHIVDPRTGYTADEIVSATVVARDAVDAGALATAFNVLSSKESRELAATVPGAEYLLVRKDGKRIASAGWGALQAPRAPAAALAAFQPKAASAAVGAAGLWNSAFELTINVEIPQAQGFGARRPYAAVWVEDKDRFPVRTLALWFNNTRWLPDLRAWYRGDRLRALSEGTEILNSVTSATRSPGKYTFKWDGKDNAGKLVKAGHYTVMVEAAREHGGYNLARHQIDVNGVPTQAQLPGEGELGAISIDYHKAVR